MSSPESIHIEWGHTEWGVCPLLAASNTAGWISTRWRADRGTVPEMTEENDVHGAIIDIVQHFIFPIVIIHCEKTCFYFYNSVNSHISLSYVIVLQLSLI